MKLSYKAPARPVEDLQWIAVASDVPGITCDGSIRLWWLDLDQGGGDRSRDSVVLDHGAQETLVYQHDKANGGMFPRSVLVPMAGAPETNTRCAVPPRHAAAPRAGPPVPPTRRTAARRVGG